MTTAKELQDKIISSLIKGNVSERSGVDALVVETEGKSPADLLEEVKKALLQGQVSERSGCDNLVYQSS